MLVIACILLTLASSVNIVLNDASEESEMTSTVHSKKQCPVDEKGNICSANGNCDDKTKQCVCNDSWSGKKCGNRLCEDNCRGNGDCFKGKCYCFKGWSGDKCDLPFNAKCPSNCNSHGVCDEKKGACECYKGYEGIGCELTKWCVDNTMNPFFTFYYSSIICNS